MRLNSLRRRSSRTPVAAYSGCAAMNLAKAGRWLTQPLYVVSAFRRTVWSSSARTVGVQKGLREAPGLARSFRLVARAGIAEESVIRVREDRVHERLAGVADALDDRVPLLFGNVMIEATPDKQHRSGQPWR